MVVLTATSVSILFATGDDTPRSVRARPPSTADSNSTVAASTSSTPPSSATAQETHVTTSSRLGFDGLGPLKLGLTLDEAVGVSGKVSQGGQCKYLDDIGNVWFALDAAGRVNFILVKNNAIRTTAGLGFGATPAQVLALYPTATREEGPAGLLPLVARESSGSALAIFDGARSKPDAPAGTVGGFELLSARTSLASTRCD
jgi:hypothetical protein